VIMLSGDEEALRRRALSALLTAATAEGDFDLETYQAGESSPTDWLASAGTAPFLSEKRTVVVRHLTRAGEPAEAFGGRTPKLDLPPAAWLILMVDEELGDESRQRKLTNHRKAWEKLVASSGGLVLNFTSSAGAMKEAVKKEVQSLGKSITSGALDELAEMTGGSLSRALDELDKLVLYVGDEKQIGPTDVKNVVVPSREWAVFTLVNAIFTGDVGSALKQLRTLVGSSTKAEDAAFSRILPTLSKQLRLIFQARVCLDAATTPGSAPPEVTASFPKRASILQEQDWAQGRAMQAARSISLSQLAQCMQIAADADARLKGLLPSFSAIETLERMVLEMAGVIKPAVRV
jgi:DNA polymerase III subunit delta